jgi:chromosome segregation ATPase
METPQTNGTTNPAEEIWAILREAARRHAENEELTKEIKQQMQETDRLMKESARRHEENEKLTKENDRRHEENEKLTKENDRWIKEIRQQMQETDRLMKETFDQMDERSKRLDKQLGDLGNSFGDMVEYMVIPNLLAKFEQMGFTFTKANRTAIKDREHDIFTEVDALLENGDRVMAVEIKNKQKTDDIDDHIERMGKLRKHADLHNDKRVYLGAAAGVVFSESAKNYALKNGLYVIEPSGDTFNITAPAGAYHPREW